MSENTNEVTVLAFPASAYVDLFGEFNGVIMPDVNDPEMSEEDKARIVRGLTTELLETLVGYSKFIPRPAAEQDPTWKQIIPYIVLLNENNEVMSYQRAKGSGESRLLGLRSIGFGGHVEPEFKHEGPYTFRERLGAFHHTIWRELVEEIGYDYYLVEDATSPDIHAFVNELSEDKTKVNVADVHFGVVVILKVKSSAALASKEEGIVDLRWTSIETLHSEVDTYEGWSKLIIKSLKIPEAGEVPVVVDQVCSPLTDA